ncbi:DdRp [Dasineura jujubifolia toursvirus 2a]|nr:DdRp [Dasineura jujubifolia toursvirus 2a]
MNSTTILKNQNNTSNGDFISEAVNKMISTSEEIKEITSISFGISSSEDIRNKSVYVANVSKYGDNKQNTVYDPRSGSLFNKRCETCKGFEQECPGHFGHIELNAVIVHPVFFKDVFNVLRVICHSCSRLIITREHMKFSSIISLEGERRLNEIILKVKKFSKCFHCNEPRREYKIKKDPINNIIIYTTDNVGDESYDTKNKTGTTKEITDEEIKNILDDIDSESLELLKMSHPKNYCIDVFPVIPPCCRPYDFVGNTIKEDDLTKQLVEIIKTNNSIPTSTDKQHVINNLKLKIETFCRIPKKKSRTINSEPIKGIRERLTGKDGQLRDNLMGKRTEMSGRTVIGPAPNLKIDEVYIPHSVATNITFPINVYETNINEVIELILCRKVEKIKRGDKIIHTDLKRYSEIMKFLRQGDVIKRVNSDDIIITNTKFNLLETDRIFRDGKDITPTKIPTILPPDVKVGDVAQRKLVDGDWVLMNRQPTLWKGSMMAFKVVISTCGTKTFGFNLAVCKAFNSDFDGDEQNAHFPQSIESKIELSLLSTPQECLLSSTNGTPVIVILQDALLGAYLMSKEDSLIVDIGTYNDIIMTLCESRFSDRDTNNHDYKYFLKRIKQIRKTLKKLNIYEGEHSLRTGRAILSLILPSDFYLDNEDLKITEGVIYSGNLTKKYLGSSHSSIIFMLKVEYNSETCAHFINEIQFITNKWLTYNSFSVNISDCCQNPGTFSIVEEKLKESEFLSKTILNKRLLEAKINLILSNAKDVGMKIAEDSSNNFVTTIKSGSKGDYFNLGQVKGLLGQQIIDGCRINYQLDNGTRTMIHYPRKNISLIDTYESRGFIMNSFARGLNPKEFFFHSMSGRQGVCDRAMTTFRSGYNMRKIIKNTEDIRVYNDGSVHDSSYNFYSHVYGELGFNPETTCKNMDRIINRLNKSQEFK